MPKERPQLHSSEGRYHPTAGSSSRSRHSMNFSGQQHYPSRSGSSRPDESFTENHFEQHYHRRSISSRSWRLFANTSSRSRDFIQPQHSARRVPPYVRSSSRSRQYLPQQFHSRDSRAYMRSVSPLSNSSSQQNYPPSSNSLGSSHSVRPNFFNQPLQSPARGSYRSRISFFWNSSEQPRPSRSVGSSRSRLWNHPAQRRHPFISSTSASRIQSVSWNEYRPPLSVKTSKRDVNKLKKASPVSDIQPTAEEMKEWDDVCCPICMEHPHNAVLLTCSSHDKGCRPFMCDTSYRHSNCLDQFSKGVSSSAQVACPLCRGRVSGWKVIEHARHYMNSEIRSCSKESCGFSGAYEGLRIHARQDHPDVRPSEADPERQHKWRRMEEQQGFDDLLSTMRASINTEDMGLLSHFFLDLSFGRGGLSPFENEDFSDDDEDAMTIENWWQDHGAWQSQLFPDGEWEELDMDLDLELAL